MKSQNHVQALGDQASQIMASFEPAWRHARARLSDSVAVDQFGLQCATLAATLSLLADRSHGLAEDLLELEE